VDSSSTLIGVAIAIPAPWAAELEQWRASFGDPQATAIPAHITLLPPTRVSAEELKDVELHLAEVATGSREFDIHLRGTATFRPVSPVVFIALSMGISGCESLEQSVRTGMLERDLDYPYHPHVTVAHDLPDEVLDHAYESLSDFSARFTVDAFSLYVHSDSGVWQVRRTFSFG
jgi:2'-5' RNA ligase